MKCVTLIEIIKILQMLMCLMLFYLLLIYNCAFVAFVSLLHRLLVLLVEATASEVVGYDDISDSIKHKLHVLGIGGAGHVAIDLFGGGLVLRFKLCLN